MASSEIGAVDWVLFGCFLCLSVAVGAYHAWKAKRDKLKAGAATANFLIGGRKMPTIPTALSLLTTFLSGITLLGAPAETYQRGLLFWLTYLAASVAFLIAAIWFIPVIFRLSPISVYEYFEYRFDSRLLRRIAAIMFLFNTLFFMAVVMYAPSVALSGVTGVPLWPFIFIVGLATTFYTGIGGLKAVVWTDTLQAVFMYAGIFTLVIKGTIDAGGVVYEVAKEQGRLAVFERINPTPAQSNSVWIASIGGVAYWISMYGLNQMALQRYCSLPGLRQVNLVIAIAVPCFLVLGTIACFLGVVILAYFHNCDPIVTKQIDTPDQLAILFAVKVLGAVPGLPGLFLACLFSGTLSTISGGMNSMAAVTWEDLVKHYMPANDRRAVLINKIMVIIYGALATALAFVCDSLGGIINSFVSILGTLAGPLIGLFFLGVLVPRATKLGAFVSLIISEAFAIWICTGNFLEKPYQHYFLDTNTTFNNDTCPYNLTQKHIYPPGTDLHFGDPSVFVMYKISPFAYGLIGILLVMIIGVPISYLTPERYRQTSPMHRALTFVGRKDPLRVREKSCTDEDSDPVTEDGFRPTYRPLDKF